MLKEIRLCATDLALGEIKVKVPAPQPLGRYYMNKNSIAWYHTTHTYLFPGDFDS